MRRRRSERGFTLLELMTTMTVSLLVLTGITGTFIAQAQQYRAHAGRRGVQASARQALNLIERELRNAGYGVDPARVFLAYDSYDAVNNASAANYPDAFTFHSRDKRFSRVGQFLSATNLQVTPALTEAVTKGQILLVLCPGARVSVYVTAGATAAAGATQIALDTSSPTESPVSMPGPRFHEQGRVTALAGEDSCLGGTGLIVTKVNRYSFFLRAFDDDNNAATLATPYLMLHRGLDTDGNGVVQWQDAVPVAAGIEQLQLAYIMNTGTSSPPLILGVNSTPAVPAYGDGWANDSTAPGPTFDDPWDDPKRLNRHPSNIRQVRVTVVARSLQASEDRKGDDQSNTSSAASIGDAMADGTIPWRQLENCVPATGNSFYPNGGNYLRSVARIAVAPKNLLMRSQFLPTRSPSSSAGGGG